MLAWSPNPYALALIVSALLSGMVAFYAWNSRPRTGSVAVTAMMLGAAEWSLGYAIAIGIDELTARVFWAKVQHIGIAMVAPSLLIFVLQHTDREAWLTRRNLALLMVMPALDVALSWSNELHGLIWREIKLVRVGSLALLDLKYGLFFWTHAFYGYLLLATSAVLLVRAVLFSSGLRRRQCAVLLAGAMMPWLANLLYLTKLSPLDYLDLTPFGYSLTGLIVMWGLYRYRLLNAVPIAREKVVEHMRDAFIVLNEQNRFVDLNPPAQALLGVSPGQVLGTSALPFFAAWPDLVERFQHEAEGLAEIVLNRNGAPRHYAVQVSQLTNRRDRVIGRLLLLQDVTDRVRALNAEHAVLQRELHLANN
ncbi:MAG TPA: histidine kinase N-terminal 7TM domain-containing protein, partial [Herpetosiphonaceae bacterium]|nr:histidine kinase N-terminal 7TM domain-containing protein [Herpetosiphonaceae bacterium]